MVLDYVMFGVGECHIEFQRKLFLISLKGGKTQMVISSVEIE